MALMSEFWGEKEYANRKAKVLKEDSKTIVVMIEDEVIVEERDLSNHSLYYAEDAAENWVMGINS